jgi:hypothetical protein
MDIIKREAPFIVGVVVGSAFNWYRIGGSYRNLCMENVLICTVPVIAGSLLGRAVINNYM